MGRKSGDRFVYHIVSYHIRVLSSVWNKHREAHRAKLCQSCFLFGGEDLVVSRATDRFTLLDDITSHHHHHHHHTHRATDNTPFVLSMISLLLSLSIHKLSNPVNEKRDSYPTQLYIIIYFLFFHSIVYFNHCSDWIKIFLNKNFFCFFLMAKLLSIGASE